jgi:uncharacterized protein (DUF342 family)
MKKIDIRISDNSLQAYMTINSFDGLTLQNIIEYVEENGIIYGVLISEIQKVFDNKIENIETLIAIGKEPVDGKDGKCTSYVDKNITLHTYETGQDFGTLPIHNVRKGQKLLKIKQHTKGERGVSVTDAKIIQKNGNPFKLVKGKNTEFSKYNSEYLVSKIDGNLAWDGKEIDVSSDYNILGNIDAHYGTIDFVGNLIIKGDVFSGVEIKTLGNLQIDGNVENAKITSSGNITIQGKCYGNGIISAKGDIIIDSVKDHTLQSLKNITINDGCFNSTIEAFSIFAPKVSIFGSSLFAFEFIEVKDFGNMVDALTKIIIGNKLYKMKLMHELEKYINDCQTSLAEVNKQYNDFLSKKMRTCFIGAEEEFDMFLLKNNIDELTTQKIDLLAWLKTLVDKLGNIRDSKLIVNGTLNPNMSLYINDLRYEKSDILSSAIFMQKDNIIISVPK